jgi:hypothetical protein
MSSKVESLCEELQTHILQHGLVGQDSKITFGFGARELDRAATPPRVVWRIVRAEHQGTPRPGLNPRPLFERIVELEAHLWGESFEQTEAMLEDAARAMHRAAVGSFRPLREEWPAEDDNDRAHQKRGAYCLLTFEVLVPVTDLPLTTVRILAAEPDTTDSDPTDGNLDVGEP